MVVVLGVAVAAGCAPPASRRGVECLAPANAGGGWDLTCRAAGQVLGQLGLIAGAVRTTNLPGAGGALAYAHTVAKRAGDSLLLVAASPATTLRISQGQYGRFTERDVRWIAAVAADYGAIAVHPDSPWHSLGEMVEAWRVDPSRLVVGGGSAAGGQDHLKILELAHLTGLEPLAIRYVPFDGGGEAMTALLGHFIQVFSGDVTEIRAQIESGSVRVLAVFAPERLPGLFAELPTAAEQGVPLEWLTWRGFYGPGDLDSEQVARWVDRLERMTASPAWAKLLAERGLAPYFSGGAAFEGLVDQQVATFRSLSRQLGLVR